MDSITLFFVRIHVIITSFFVMIPAVGPYRTLEDLPLENGFADLPVYMTMFL